MTNLKNKKKNKKNSTEYFCFNHHHFYVSYWCFSTSMLDNLSWCHKIQLQQHPSCCNLALLGTETARQRGGKPTLKEYSFTKRKKKTRIWVLESLIQNGFFQKKYFLISESKFEG